MIASMLYDIHNDYDAKTNENWEEQQKKKQMEKVWMTTKIPHENLKCKIKFWIIIQPTNEMNCLWT